MKVLEKGTGQKGWSTTMRCTGNGNGGGGCSAKLLIEHGDLFITHSYHYDGSHETYITFRCPECKVKTDISNYTGPTVLKGKR